MTFLRAGLGTLVLLAANASGCAVGSDLDGIVGGGGDGGEGGVGQNLNGSGGANNAGPGPGPTTSTSSNGGSSANNTTNATNSTTSGPTTTNATNSTTSGPTTTNATTSTGTVMCAPEAPSAGCGPNMHCVPTLDVADDPTCEPAGSGGPYALCVDRSQCAAENECISDGVDACCMTWCVLGGNDCSAFETCTELGAPLYANGQAYGVCWDGYPCVI